MKKILMVLICVTVMTASFAGCSSNSGNNAESAGGTSASTESSAAPAAPSGEKIVMKVGHGAPESVAMHKGWEKFKEEVEKASEGNILVEIYPNQQMGGDRELIESTQMGDLTACSPSSTPLASFCKEFFVLDIPFLFGDRVTAYTVLDGPAGQQLLSSVEEVGLKGSGYMENGFRNFTNSKVQVRQPDDVKGLKIRTMENKIHMAFWSLAGASPTPMAYGELFTALQQKTVDGQENPFELICSSKFYEVQSNITETQHIYTPYVVLFNLGFYNGLSDENKEIIDDAVKIAVDYARECSIQSEIDSKQIIEDAGVTIISLTAEEKNAFREVMSEVLPQVKEAAGDIIVDLFIKEANYQ